MASYSHFSHQIGNIAHRHITVTAEQEGESFTIQTKSIVLAAGGFESSTTLRSQHMGSHWEKAHVRGTPYNKGEVLSLALDQLKAKPTGDWGGCHAVAWDANAPKDCGDRQVSNEFTKSGYPLGITLNIHGLRFFDEGSDLRNYTYAKFGRAILAQPEGEAFQIWDQKGVKWLRSEEYRDGVVEKIHGDTMEELAGKLLAKGLKDKEAFIRTVEGYNNSVYAHRNEHPDAKWDPAILDTLSTQSSTSTLEIPKSNWALPLDKAPFMAVKVGCGVTFTFGGLAIDPKTAGVISAEDGSVIPGVFCAGEMVGGLFYENYPGGSGLTSGAVFGRKAGIGAAVFAEEKGL
ncbi:putative Fumarate reductase flavoprotein subunit [Glarea lozoyensis 74030]|uniref:Putative Fumarate reductase flavoprotein subunit n=1 Tax=Glarea lozoyensis (strain ATCC 74030 / MF5533) TaxID=1104152 RepID=H0EWS7_GLAL7|nr:putative Fumarate reductase flavoprotein subunit [Glarea lozoyensis 74030]